jgi:hypothetical protein
MTLGDSQETAPTGGVLNTKQLKEAIHSLTEARGDTSVWRDHRAMNAFRGLQHIGKLFASMEPVEMLLDSPEPIMACFRVFSSSFLPLTPALHNDEVYAQPNRVLDSHSLPCN